MTTEMLPATLDAAPYTRNRRPRGQHPKRIDESGERAEEKMPEYLEAHQVNALLPMAERNY